MVLSGRGNHVFRLRQTSSQEEAYKNARKLSSLFLLLLLANHPPLEVMEEDTPETAEIKRVHAELKQQKKARMKAFIAKIQACAAEADRGGGNDRRAVPKTHRRWVNPSGGY